MATLRVDNTAHTLPADEFSAQKVTSYNTPLNAINAAWTVWSPTWTNLTVGNGTVTARFREIGTLVICRLHVLFGSTTTVSGDIQFSLPVTRATYAGSATLTPLGSARAFDASTGSVVNIGDVVNTSTTVASIRFHNASGTHNAQAIASATVPFTWAVSDEIAAQFIFEAA